MQTPIEHASNPNIYYDDLIVRINEMDAVFTQFNNKRSLVMDSKIKTKQFGNTTALIDPNRPNDGYYNRVVGFTEKDLPYLDDILNWYDKHQSICIFSLAPTQQTDSILDAIKFNSFSYNGHDCIFNAPAKENTNTLPVDITIEQITENTLDDLFQFLGNIWPVKDEYCRQNKSYYIK